MNLKGLGGTVPNRPLRVENRFRKIRDYPLLFTIYTGLPGSFNENQVGRPGLPFGINKENSPETNLLPHKEEGFTGDGDPSD